MVPVPTRQRDSRAHLNNSAKDITIKNKTVYLMIYRYCSNKKVEGKKKKLAHFQMLAVSLSSRSMDLLKADIQKNLLKPFKAVLSVLPVTPQQEDKQQIDPSSTL